MAGGFLPYHEPGSTFDTPVLSSYTALWRSPDWADSVVEILIIISFFFFLSLAEWVSAKVLRAGIIGQIAIGIIYGKPLADILEMDWQKAFLAVGYVGLILVIFEG